MLGQTFYIYIDTQYIYMLKNKFKEIIIYLFKINKNLSHKLNYPFIRFDSMYVIINDN